MDTNTKTLYCETCDADTPHYLDTSHVPYAPASWVCEGYDGAPDALFHESIPVTDVCEA